MFKPIGGNAETKTIFFGNEKDQVKEATFYPVDFKAVTSKKGKDYNFILAVLRDEAGAEMVSVLAHGQVCTALCDNNGEEGKKREYTGLKADVRGTLVRVKWLGKDGKYHNYSIEQDADKKLKKYEMPPI